MNRMVSTSLAARRWASVDIFAGSNTTGQVAEAEGRRWLSFELSREYVAASVFRFLDKEMSVERVQASHELIR